MASSIAGPSQPRPRPRPPRLEGQADDAAAAAAVAQMPRRGGTSNATPISLETFQSTTFDVSQFVTQLMDDNVKRGTRDATGSSGGQSAVSLRLTATDTAAGWGRNLLACSSGNMERGRAQARGGRAHHRRRKPPRFEIRSSRTGTMFLAPVRDRTAALSAHQNRHIKPFERECKIALLIP